jgi:hypothetical protein
VIRVIHSTIAQLYIIYITIYYQQKHNALNKNKKNWKLTAAIEGWMSSPGEGWDTSAPKIIVGTRPTTGTSLVMASARTVFLPPTYVFKQFDKNL